MANSYRGQVELDIAGRRRTLRYSWAAILALREEFGDGFDSALTDAMMQMDLPRISTAIAIGLREDWPDCTADDVMRASPPISPSLAAVQKALELAFHGPEGAPPERPENPLLAAWSRLKATLSGLPSWRALLPA